MLKRYAVVLLVLLVLPIFAFADQLEIRRSANIYVEPNRQSEVLAKIDPSEHDEIYVIQLLQDEKVNGYYRVRVAGEATEGWIYKTLVRRIQGQHPDYVPYKRTLYKHWIDADGDCQNTRAEVLIRDSIGPVTFKPPKKCVVVSGKWRDPYSGEIFTDARKVDVDHVVPLKNAHESGGWAWSKKKRTDYANNLKNSYHLLAVSASENRKKGAKGPDLYMPSNNSYRCEYVEIWTKIKSEWNLEMTEAEGEKVESVDAQCR